MRKNWLFTVGSLLAVILLSSSLLLGCDNPVAEPLPEPVPLAPFVISGNVTGVIVDGLTGLPLAGATVSIANKDLTAVTDARGHYVIENVPPNKAEDGVGYTLVVSADGYETYTSNDSVVVINPSDFVASDPFGAFKLLDAWGGSNSVLGLGVSVNELIEAGLSQISDRSWTTSAGVQLITLVPVSTISGKLEVVYAINAAPEGYDIVSPVAIHPDEDAAVVAWFEKNVTISGGSTITHKYYFAVDEEGKFTAKDVPVDVINLKINPFTQNGLYFEQKTATKLFIVAGKDAKAVGTGSAAIAGITNGTYDIGTIYAFANGAKVGVTVGGATVTNITSPIVLTFDTEIDPLHFSLDVEDTAPVNALSLGNGLYSVQDGDQLTYDVVGKVVTVTPKTGFGWAYSADDKYPAFTLKVSSTAKTAKGAEVAFAPIDVYSAQGLVLKGVKPAPANTTRASSTPLEVPLYGGLEYTFNKDIATTLNPSPKIGDEEVVYKVDGTKLIVFTDLDDYDGSDNFEVEFTVVNSADPYDILEYKSKDGGEFAYAPQIESAPKVESFLVKGQKSHTSVGTITGTPTDITVFFSKKLTGGTAKLTWNGGDGTAVATGTVTPGKNYVTVGYTKQLAPGYFTLEWDVTSATGPYKDTESVHVTYDYTLNDSFLAGVTEGLASGTWKLSANGDIDNANIKLSYAIPKLTGYDRYYTVLYRYKTLVGANYVDPYTELGAYLDQGLASGADAIPATDISVTLTTSPYKDAGEHVFLVLLPDEKGQLTYVKIPVIFK